MQPESDDGFKRWIMAGGGNISDMGRAEDNAVYNSRIAGMLNRSFSQLISLLPLVLILLISSSSRVYAQNWATAEEQLARKIVSAIGTKIIAVEVSNRSSISRSNADAIRRGLLTELATLGMRFANTEQAGAVVHISLSENTQSYVWVAEIRQAANEPSVLMISLPRSEAQSVDGEASAMVLHKMLVWSQQERILDLAVIEGGVETEQAEAKAAAAELGAVAGAGVAAGPGQHRHHLTGEAHRRVGGRPLDADGNGRVATTRMSPGRLEPSHSA